MCIGFSEEIFDAKLKAYGQTGNIFLCCMLGPILTDSDYWFGLVLAVPFCPHDIEVIVSIGDFPKRRQGVYSNSFKN